MSGVRYQEYKCKNCGGRFTGPWVDGDTPELFPDCPNENCYLMGHVEGHNVVKSYRVSVREPMKEHYNLATGSWENSYRTVEEKLKIAGEEASERTGIPHKFAPVDLRDKEALGVDDEGLDATYKRRRDSGQTQAKTVYIT